MKKTIIKGLILITSTFYFGCNNSNDSESSNETGNDVSQHEQEIEEQPEPREYKLDLETNMVESRKLQLRINTNFPDGSQLMISIGRIYKTKDDDTEYWGEILSDKIIVKNGVVELTTIIDDAKWHDRAVKLTQDMPEDFPPIVNISDEVKISVTFTPKGQSEEVLKIVGTDGEYIRGEGINNDMSFTTFEASEKLNIPFEK